MRKKRAPWPRWAKVLRNLLLVALLGFMMWDLWDHPTFFYMTDLRRRERRALFPEAAETVVELDTAGGVKYRIEVTDGIAVTSYPRRGDFFTTANASFWKLKDGPDLICLSRPVELPDEFGQPLTYAVYAAVQPPAGSAGAVLTLHVDGGDYIAEGVWEDGLFLFYVRPEPDENGVVRMGGNWFPPDLFAYELKFFDQSGNSVCVVSG